jgi:hypothetical protein
MVLRVHREFKARRVLQAQQGLPEQQVHKELRVILVTQVLMAHRAFKV